LADQNPTRQSNSQRGRWIAVAKWTIGVVVVIGIVLAARKSADQWQQQTAEIGKEIEAIDVQISQASGGEIRKLQAERSRLDAAVPRFSNLRWNHLGLAGLIYAIGLVPPSFLLHRALITLGERPRVSTTIAAQLLGHVGKYVPGKAMVIILRAGVLSRDGIGPLKATVSVFLETFLMMAVGATLAGIVVCWLPVPRWIAISSVVAAIAASLPTLPPILKYVAAKVTKVRIAEIDHQIGVRLFVAGWGWSILSWLLVGLSFTFVVSAMPTANALSSPLQLYAISTAAVALAMVIGFASLLPGGAGVRELVMTTILGVSLGTAHGLLAAIAARILYLVVEAGLAGLCWWWMKSQEHRSQRDPSD
jgi:glycosyltransferase 2 family protein